MSYATERAEYEAVHYPEDPDWDDPGKAQTPSDPTPVLDIPPNGPYRGIKNGPPTLSKGAEHAISFIVGIIVFMLLGVLVGTVGAMVLSLIAVEVVHTVVGIMYPASTRL